MAVTFPYVRAATWADGSTTDTAAKRNTIEDGIFNAHQQPAVRVFHNANQSITSGTQTALAFNSERFDVAGGSASTQHDTVTNNSRLTCRYAGKYQIVGSVAWAASASGQYRTLSIRLNGATVICVTTMDPSASHFSEQNIATLYDLAVNDYVELTVVQNTGGGLNITNNANYSPEFMMVRVA